MVQAIGAVACRSASGSTGPWPSLVVGSTVGSGLPRSERPPRELRSHRPRAFPPAKRHRSPNLRTSSSRGGRPVARRSARSGNRCSTVPARRSVPPGTTGVVCAGVPVTLPGGSARRALVPASCHPPRAVARLSGHQSREPRGDRTGRGRRRRGEGVAVAPGAAHRRSSGSDQLGRARCLTPSRRWARSCAAGALGAARVGIRRTAGDAPARGDLRSSAQGRLTEAGERVGEITTDGTIGFLVFVGLGGGLVSGDRLLGGATLAAVDRRRRRGWSSG